MKKEMHQKWMNEYNERFLYILKLEYNKYYIGQSATPNERIEKQFKGKGSAWTKLHKPIEVISIKSIGIMDYKDAENVENEIVLQYMRKYGWENVRGGYFTYIDNDVVLKNLLSHKKRKTMNIDFID
ncbi:GIY-YIG nuclease family protein [Neobacillus sp. 179-J 1A1 HS]|uniref:GIY-YIG nuclease family protein n=1 Tax=Neobacillus driksii TaxID=3035913 RepID=UPI0035BC8D9D